MKLLPFSSLPSSPFSRRRDRSRRGRKLSRHQPAQVIGFPRDHGAHTGPSRVPRVHGAIVSPIYQCSNGHAICSTCKPKVNNSCPTCRHEMGDIRALTVEKMAAPMELPCRYHASGCAGLYRYDRKLEHELGCKFRPFGCPYPFEPCPFAADVQSLVRHLQHDHQSDLREGSEIEEVFHHIQPCSEESAKFNVSIYAFEGEHFCLHFEAFPSPLDVVYMAFLTFMGDEEDTKRFIYYLQVENGDKRMIWRGTPRSIREGGSRIRESHDGLVIHRSVANLLAEINTEDELKLRVKGYILK